MKRLILFVLWVIASVCALAVTGQGRVVATARNPEASARLGGGGAHTSPIGPKLNSQQQGGMPPGHP